MQRKQHWVSAVDKGILPVLLAVTSENMVYNGKTERQSKERITEHLRDVMLNGDKPTNSHFRKNHTVDMLRYTVHRKFLVTFKTATDKRICLE